MFGPPRFARNPRERYADCFRFPDAKSPSSETLPHPNHPLILHCIVQQGRICSAARMRSSQIIGRLGVASVTLLFSGGVWASRSALTFQEQQVDEQKGAGLFPYDIHSDYWLAEEGVGHFSEWSKSQKRKFIDVVRSGDDAAIAQWTVVMGNEGGDLDSMTSALAWGYHLDHIGSSSNATRKWTGDQATTVALLQTPEDALNLRPENKLALSNAKMSPGHRDLLTIDELPLPAAELAKKIKGIVIVDHAVPLSVWKAAKVLSIMDHHTDRGIALDASPRIFGRTASCSTIVADMLLNQREEAANAAGKDGKEYHLPHELIELILSAIALDSDALSHLRASTLDLETAARLLKLSNFKGEKLQPLMDRLDSEMGKAKKALDSLSVRDLLHRDWKGDV